MNKRIISILIAALTALTLTACGKEKEEETTSSVEETSSIAETISSEEPAETQDTPDIADTLDSPDFSQREAVVSPYTFPYIPDDLKEDLIDYGNSIGLTYNGYLTMQSSTATTKIETRSAVNERVLEAWCKDEIDDVATLAKNNNIPLNEIEFNITVIESAKYDNEYDITLYSSCK